MSFVAVLCVTWVWPGVLTAAHSSVYAFRTVARYRAAALKNQWRSEERVLGRLSWHVSSLKGMPQGSRVKTSEFSEINSSSRRGRMGNNNNPFLRLKADRVVHRGQGHARAFVELNHGDVETENVNETWVSGRESVLAAVECLKRGNFVCVSDDVDR